MRSSTPTFSTLPNGEIEVSYDGTVVGKMYRWGKYWAFPTMYLNAKTAEAKRKLKEMNQRTPGLTAVFPTRALAAQSLWAFYFDLHRHEANPSDTPPDVLDMLWRLQGVTYLNKKLRVSAHQPSTINEKRAGAARSIAGWSVQPYDFLGKPSAVLTKGDYSYRVLAGARGATVKGLVAAIKRGLTAK